MAKVKADCEAQVGAVFCEVENTRADVIRLRERNAKLKQQLEFIRLYRQVRPALEDFLNEKSGVLADQVTSLLEGLRQCRNHLKVIGLKMVRKELLFMNSCISTSLCMPETDEGSFVKLRRRLSILDL